MKTTQILKTAGEQLTECLIGISDEQTDLLADAICSANHIYVCGAGRSLLMLRCFAMRLMHLGFTSYVTGDTTTPAFREGDLMIAASASGSTGSVVSVSRKVKELGGTLAVLTINKDSVLGQMADVLVEIPGYTDKVPMEGERPLIPGGSLFEQSVLVLGDSLVLPLSRKNNIPLDRAFELHANLE